MLCGSPAVLSQTSHVRGQNYTRLGISAPTPSPRGWPPASEQHTLLRQLSSLLSHPFHISLFDLDYFPWDDGFKVLF